MVETFRRGRLLGTAPLGKAGRKHMYLKRLEMRGFKSFVDAQVSFQPGITAVVGPNGTGKSNILDAVLWVLGEQSTTALRSERMEDVIFNGTESRQPLGMAEVSLILGDVDGRPHDNGNGSGEAAALPFALGECHEVMVTRRLFRDGMSEYFINKASCRLKDIRSLLLDTRAGSKGHTVIEQGRIDRVLKASPVERRELIEETAGIIRYKRQKAEALRKLEATHQLGVAEGEATLAGLREQVAQAEAKLAQAVATLELLAQRASLLDEQRARVQADIERLTLEQQESTDHLARLSVRLEQLAHELALRSGVAAESEAVLAEGVRRQRDNQAALDAARKAVMDQAIAAADTNNRLAGDRARAAELRRRVGYEVVGGDPGAAATLKGTVAQVLSVPKGYERAIEAVLGHRLLGRLVEGRGEAVKVLQILKTQGTAGGTFVPKRPRMWEARASAGWRGAGVVGPARDLVTPRAGYEDLVAHLLAGVVVVEALEQALGLWKSMTADRQALLVTLGGEVLTPDGIVSGGPAGAVAGALSRERGLRDLAAGVTRQ